MKMPSNNTQVALLLLGACSAPLAAADDCATLDLSFSVTREDQQKAQQACKGQTAACLNGKLQERSRLRQAAALHKFLANCIDSDHANYAIATNLLAAMTSQAAPPTTTDAAPTTAYTPTQETSGALATSPASTNATAPTIASTLDDRKVPKEGTDTVTTRDKPAENDVAPAASAAEKAITNAAATQPLKLQTDRPWLATLTVGNQFLPDYKQGETSKLNHSQAFAEVMVDHRSADDRNPALASLHWGTLLQLEGVPVSREQGKKTSELRFDDVSQSLSVGIYGLWSIDNFSWFAPSSGQIQGNDHATNYSSQWFWAGKLSVRARDKLGDNQDGIDPIAEVGLHYRYNEFSGLLGDGNVMPRGSLSIGIGYWDSYEDLLGDPRLTDARWRYLIRGEYRLADSVPFYLGFKGNLGQGPDNLGLYLSMRLNADQFLALFGETKGK